MIYNEVTKSNSKKKSESLDKKGEPNSTTQKKGKDGEVTQERHYDKDGNPDYDIDYSDHGNPKNHTNPHKHTWKDGKRGPAEPVDSNGKNTATSDSSSSGTQGN